MLACYVPVCLKKKHNARKAVWFTKATVHWSNFCIFVDSIDSQIILRMKKHQRKQNIPTSPAFWPCLCDDRCDTCRQGLFSTSVTSTNNGKIHNIKQPVTYKTKNVCYFINCKKCSQQYTGEMKLEFHLRMNNHNSDVRTNKKSTRMMWHFSNCGVTSIQPTILERVLSSDPFIHKAR